MFVIIGYIIVVGAIVGGFLMAGGHVGVLIQPNEAVIIFGGALGAFIVRTTPRS